MSAFRSHGRGHLNGPVVVIGTGLLGASIGLGLRGRGVPVFLSDPSPTNQAVAVDIGAGQPLASFGDEAPELVVVAAPPDVTAAVVARALADYPDSVVVDIASVKAAILAELRARGADLCPLRGHATRWPGGKSPGRLRPAASSSRPCRGWFARPRSPPPAAVQTRVPWPRTSEQSFPSSRRTNTTKPWHWCRTCPRSCRHCWPAGCRGRRSMRCPWPATACGTSPGSPPAIPPCGSRSWAATRGRWWRSSTASART